MKEAQRVRYGFMVVYSCTQHNSLKTSTEIRAHSVLNPQWGSLELSEMYITLIFLVK